MIQDAPKQNLCMYSSPRMNSVHPCMSSPGYHLHHPGFFWKCPHPGGYEMHQDWRVRFSQCKGDFCSRNELPHLRYVFPPCHLSSCVLFCLGVSSLRSSCLYSGLCGMGAFSYYGNKIREEYSDPNFKAQK